MTRCQTGYARTSCVVGFGEPNLTGDHVALTPETEAQILRSYHAERWPVGTIARHLHVHRDSVARVLGQAGLPRLGPSLRPSGIDPYLPFILQTLERFPGLRASRLYDMVKARGYGGRPDHFRHLIARHRPRPKAEAYLRLRSLPAEQMQVDWGHFDHLQIGQARRPLMAFVAVLSWSRQIFLRFYLGAHMENFLRGHLGAFVAWGGCPRVALYDNLKSAVLEREGSVIRFNPTLLAMAGHYRFELSVREAFAQERASLLALPPNAFPTEEVRAVTAGKTPYVRFDLNDYSIPHTCVARTLTVAASPREVRILDAQTVVATHVRSYDRRQQIEQDGHIDALTDHKREARAHRGTDQLIKAIPISRTLLAQATERGEPLARTVRALAELRTTYGATQLEAAIHRALARGAPHPNAVRLALEQQRQANDKPPPLPIALPEHVRRRDVPVRPHNLNAYDHLMESDDEQR